MHGDLGGVDEASVVCLPKALLTVRVYQMSNLLFCTVVVEPGPDLLTVCLMCTGVDCALSSDCHVYGISVVILVMQLVVLNAACCSCRWITSQVVVLGLWIVAAGLIELEWSPHCRKNIS